MRFKIKLISKTSIVFTVNILLFNLLLISSSPAAEQSATKSVKSEATNSQPKVTAAGLSKGSIKRSDHVDSSAKFQARMMSHQDQLGQYESWQPHNIPMPTFVDQEQGDEMVALASDSGDSAEQAVKVASPIPSVRQSKGGFGSYRSEQQQADIQQTKQREKGEKDPQQVKPAGSSSTRLAAFTSGPLEMANNKQTSMLEEYYANMSDDLEDEQQEQQEQAEAHQLKAKPQKDQTNHEQEAAFYRDQQAANKTSQKAFESGWLPASSRQIQTLTSPSVPTYHQKAAGEKLAELFGSSVVGQSGPGNNMASKADLAIEYLRNVLRDKQSSQNGSSSNVQELDLARNNKNASLHRLSSFASRLNQLMLNNSPNQKVEEIGGANKSSSPVLTGIDLSEKPILAQQADVKFSISDVKPSTLTPEIPSTSTTRQPTTDLPQYSSSPQQEFTPEQAISSFQMGNLNGAGDYMEDLNDYPRAQQQMFSIESQQVPVALKHGPLEHTIRHQAPAFRSNPTEYSGNADEHHHKQQQQHNQKAPSSTRFFQMQQHTVHPPPPASASHNNYHQQQSDHYQKQPTEAGPQLHGAYGYEAGQIKEEHAIGKTSKPKHINPVQQVTIEQQQHHVPIGSKIYRDPTEQHPAQAPVEHHHSKVSVFHQKAVEHHRQPVQQPQHYEQHQLAAQLSHLPEPVPIQVPRQPHLPEPLPPYPHLPEPVPQPIEHHHHQQVINHAQGQQNEKYAQPQHHKEHPQATHYHHQKSTLRPPKIVSYNYEHNLDESLTKHYQIPVAGGAHNQSALGELLATNYQLGDALYSSSGGLEHPLSQHELDAIQSQFLTAEHPVVTIPVAQPNEHHSNLKHNQQYQEQQLAGLLANHLRHHQESQMIDDSMKEAELEQLMSAASQQPAHKARSELQPAHHQVIGNQRFVIDDKKSTVDRKKNLVVYLNHPRPDEMSSKQKNGDESVAAKEFDIANGLMNKDMKQLEEFKLNSSDKDKDGLSVVVINDAYKYKKIVLLISSKTGGLKFIPMLKDSRK